jgi:hypothetical protein
MTFIRRALSFLVAPLAVTSFWVGFAAIGDGDVRSVAELVSAITVAHSVVLGVPMALTMARLGKLTLRNTALASFLIGAIPLPTFLLFDPSPTNTLATALLFGLSGLAAGLVWWPIWRVSSNKQLQRTGNA